MGSNGHRVMKPAKNSINLDKKRDRMDAYLLDSGLRGTIYQAKVNGDMKRYFSVGTWWLCQDRVLQPS